MRFLLFLLPMILSSLVLCNIEKVNKLIFNLNINESNSELIKLLKTKSEFKESARKSLNPATNKETYSSDFTFYSHLVLNNFKTGRIEFQISEFKGDKESIVLYFTYENEEKMMKDFNLLLLLFNDSCYKKEIIDESWIVYENQRIKVHVDKDSLGQEGHIIISIER